MPAEQAIRLARIRAQVREGVWGVRYQVALQGDGDTLGREVQTDTTAPEPTGAAISPRQRL